MPVRVDDVKIVGEFALDYLNDITVFDNSLLRQLNESFVGCTEVSANLLKGFNKFVDSEEFGSKTTGLVDYITKRMEEEELDLKDAVNGANVVSSRNLLVKIAESPYAVEAAHFDHGFKFICCLYEGILFICEDKGVKTEETLEPLKVASLWKTKGCYIGLKFEQLITLGEGQCKPNYSGTANSDISYNGVYECKLTNAENPSRSHHLFISSKIDCVDKDGDYVEIISQRIPKPPSDTDEVKLKENHTSNEAAQKTVAEMPKENENPNKDEKPEEEQKNANEKEDSEPERSPKDVVPKAAPTPSVDDIKLEQLSLFDEKTKDENTPNVEKTPQHAHRGMFPWPKQMRTYLRALLSGQNRIIVGRCDRHRLIEVCNLTRDNIVEECVEWEQETCLGYLAEFLTKITCVLDKLPRGKLLCVERKQNRVDYKVTKIADADYDEYEFLGETFREMINA